MVHSRFQRSHPDFEHQSFYRHRCTADVRDTHGITPEEGEVTLLQTGFFNMGMVAILTLSSSWQRFVGRLLENIARQSRTIKCIGPHCAVTIVLTKLTFRRANQRRSCCAPFEGACFNEPRNGSLCVSNVVVVVD